jgi:hypothetical protein
MPVELELISANRGEEMAKPKITWKIQSWGLYTAWDRQARVLPEIQEFTDKIPALPGVEFGYILQIKKARGKQIHFTIEHPPFLDKDDQPTPPFTGEVYVRSNDWQFFLGDTIWEPVEDKCGPWRLIVALEGEVMADKTFLIVEES